MIMPQYLDTLLETYGGEKGYISTYDSSKAPKGGHGPKIDDGTYCIRLTDEINDANYSPFRIESGDYVGRTLWMENTHVRVVKHPEPEPNIFVELLAKLIEFITWLVSLINKK